MHKGKAGLKKALRSATVGVFALAMVSIYGCMGGGGGGDDAVVAQPAQVVNTTVTVDSGTIAGQKLASSVTAFYGIPYAAPPVGNLRWKEPQSITWTGTKETVKMGNACA